MVLRWVVSVIHTALNAWIFLSGSARRSYHWRRAGVMTVVMLCLALLGVVLAVFLGGMAAMMGLR